MQPNAQGQRWVQFRAFGTGATRSAALAVAASRLARSVETVTWHGSPDHLHCHNASLMGSVPEGLRKSQSHEATGLLRGHFLAIAPAQLPQRQGVQEDRARKQGLAHSESV